MSAMRSASPDGDAPRTVPMSDAPCTPSKMISRASRTCGTVWISHAPAHSWQQPGRGRNSNHEACVALVAGNRTWPCQRDSSHMELNGPDCLTTSRTCSSRDMTCFAPDDRLESWHRLTSENGLRRERIWRCRMRPGCRLVKLGRSWAATTVCLPPCRTRTPCSCAPALACFCARAPATWRTMDCVGSQQQYTSGGRGEEGKHTS